MPLMKIWRSVVSVSKHKKKKKDTLEYPGFRWKNPRFSYIVRVCDFINDKLLPSADFNVYLEVA